jgi:hypothetical protein
MNGSGRSHDGKNGPLGLRDPVPARMRHGPEGIVAKRRDRPYRSGRSPVLRRGMFNRQAVVVSCNSALG